MECTGASDLFVMKLEVLNLLAFEKLEVHKSFNSGCWDVIIKIWRDTVYNFCGPLCIAFISPLRRYRCHCEIDSYGRTICSGTRLSCLSTLLLWSIYFSFHFQFCYAQTKVMEDLKATHPSIVFIRTSSKKLSLLSDGLFFWNMLLEFPKIVKVSVNKFWSLSSDKIQRYSFRITIWVWACSFLHLKMNYSDNTGCAMKINLFVVFIIHFWISWWDFQLFLHV